MCARTHTHTHTHTKRCQQLHNKGHYKGAHIHPAFHTGALRAQGTKECLSWVVVTQGYYMGFYFYYFIYFIFDYIYFFFYYYLLHSYYLFIPFPHSQLYELLWKCTSSPSNNYTEAHTGDATQQGLLRRRTSSPGVLHRGTTSPLNQGVSTTKWNLRATIWKHLVVY